MLNVKARHDCVVASHAVLAFGVHRLRIHFVHLSHLRLAEEFLGGARSACGDQR